MTRRRRLRRRLLWAGVLLGLLLLLTTVSVVRAGIWARETLLTTLIKPHGKERRMFAKTSFTLVAMVGALLLAASATADDWGAHRQEVPSMLDARERALVEKQAATPAPGWLARIAAAHSVREPVVDDRFRIDPTATEAPVATTSSDVEWPQIGIGIAFAVALGLGVLLAIRRPQPRPPLAH
jgi:hypothetical protein